MGCDYEEETCLEITWIDSFNNQTITSCYVMEDYTKYKYFQVDSSDIKDLEPELAINFQPIQIVANGSIDYEMDLDRIVELDLFKISCGTYSVCEWVKSHLLNWIGSNTLLEDIIEGKSKCEFNSKIIGIKLIKRNYYLEKYYY